MMDGSTITAHLRYLEPGLIFNAPGPVLATDFLEVILIQIELNLETVCATVPRRQVAI